MRKTTLYTSLLLCWQFLSAQQFPAIRFSHLTTKEGLSNNAAAWITQDRDGFIWVGTSDGLNRLDGYRIKSFYHRAADSNSLVANQVAEMQGDAGGNLWIGTYGGISYYNKLQNSFTNFKHKTADSASLSSDWCQAMYFDPLTHQLWACVRHAIYCFGEDLHYQRIDMDLERFPAVNKQALTYFKLYEDHEHQLWACCEKFLIRIDRRSKKVLQMFQTNGPFIRCILEVSPGNFWLGTFNSGLLHLNTATGVFDKVPLPPEDFHIDNLCEWKDTDHRKWWVIGANTGLILMDPVSLKYTTLTPDPTDDYSISPGEITCLFTDKTGILWIGTESGVSYVEPSKQLIASWALGPTTLPKKYNTTINFAYSFFAAAEGYYAGHWAGDGLFHYDRAGKLTGLSKNLHGDKPGLINVFAIHPLKNGHLLLSTETGIVEYDPKKEKWIGETTDPATPSPGFRTMQQYDDSTWYIRTRNNGPAGIYVYNSNRKKWVAHYAYKENCADCLPSAIHSLLITRNKTVFAAPEKKYLYVLDKPSGKFLPLFTSPQQMARLPSDIFECLAEGPDGNLWVGTPNGLFELNPAAREMVADYSTHALIGGLEIENLCFDDDANLWMNTRRGMFCLDSRTKQVFNFNTGDGLPSNSFPGFLYRGDDGHMYAGSLGYIIKFDPRHLLHQKITGEIKLSGITVMENSHPVIGNATEKTITLEPWQKIFSVDYSVLNYDNPAGNRYFYRIDGLMKEWRENENGHLQFNNFSPGDYILHMKGGDKYGNTFPGEDSVVIHIKPYWWRSKWFYALLISLLALGLGLLISRRIGNIRRESSFRTKIAEAELMALRTQMNPHFIFNCMNIIDGLIVSNRKEDAQAFLQKFSKLIRLVLENSQHQQVLVQQDLDALKLYIELEAIRFNHHFQYEFDIDEDLVDENYKIPPLILQPYVENAIVHGLRNKEGGEGKLTVRLKKVEGYLIAEIEDNGIGRKKAALLEQENQMNHQQLGMKVTAQRIDLLRQINANKVNIVVSNLSQEAEPGTKVTITL